MNIKQLIDELEEIAEEIGEDCYLGICPDTLMLAIYEVRGQLITEIQL